MQPVRWKAYLEDQMAYIIGVIQQWEQPGFRAKISAESVVSVQVGDCASTADNLAKRLKDQLGDKAETELIEMPCEQ